MKFKMVFLIILVVCILKIQSVHSMQEDAMDTWKTKIDVNDPSWTSFSTGRLKSHSGISYQPNFQKTLVISAPRGYSIFAAFRTLDFRPNSQDSVTLYAEGTGSTFIYSNTKSYKKELYDSREEKYTLFAKSGQLRVTFYTGPIYTTSTSGYKGFELIYTTQANYTNCLSSYFRCKNGQCINNGLKCDGHNHCGDRSDQRNCPWNVGFGPGKTVGVVCGVIFLVIAAGCAIYIILRRKRSQTEVTTIINHPPEANLPGYVQPPAYPQGNYYPPPPPPYSNYNQGANNPGFR